jgi:hypothetical protein
MSLSLQNIRDGILKATATDIEDWDNGNTDLDLYANQSWWDVSDQFDFREKETSIIFPTVGGQDAYSIPVIISPIIFDALQTISIEDPNDFSHSDLKLISLQDFENEFINTASEQAKPTHYYRRGNSLVLYPTPDTIYNITLYYMNILSDIPSQGPVIPQSWHEIIKYGAIWRALLDVQDYRKASDVRNIQIDLINSRTPVKAKELADTKFAGVDVPGRDYP